MERQKMLKRLEKSMQPTLLGIVVMLLGYFLMIFNDQSQEISHTIQRNIETTRTNLVSIEVIATTQERIVKLIDSHLEESGHPESLLKISDLNGKIDALKVILERVERKVDS